MNPFIEILNQWGGRFVDFAWPMLWQSSLLIVILFAIDFSLRRRIRASIRYALWLVVLVKLCVPPTLALPTSPIWWLPGMQPPAEPPVHYTVTYGTQPLPEVPQNPAPVYVPPEPAMTSAAWFLLGSGFISVLLLALLLARWRHISKLVRSSKFSVKLTAMLNETRELTGVTRSSPVSLAQNTTSPAICGLFRPAILIPQSLAEKFSDEQLRAVLLHELVHLRRRDVWLNCLQALLQIVYWWNPLLWLANARVRHVREEAVDDAVMLALRDKSETYAPTLLEVAKLALKRPLGSLGLVGILESRSALRQRIERLVNFRTPRRAGLTLISLLGIAAFAAIAVPMGNAPQSDSNNDEFGGQKEIVGATNTISALRQTGANNLAELTKLAVLDLKKHFQSTNEQTRANALGKFASSPVTVTEAENPALDDALPILIQATKDKDRMIRSFAVDALWRIRPTNQQAVKALGNLVDFETDLNAAVVAASTLKEIGPAAAPAVPDLIWALEHRNEDGTITVGASSKIEPNFPVGTALRRAIIETLGNIGPAAQSTIPILRKLLNDTGKFSLGYRIFSAKALWQITGRTNETLPVLINALKTHDSVWAADVLGMMGQDARPAVPALQKGLQSRIGYTRLRSALALSKIEPGFQVPMPLLLTLLNDPNSAARFESAQMIWSKTHDSQRVLPTLLDLIKPDKRQPFGMDLDYYGEKAIPLLGEIGPPAKAAVPRLEEIIQHSPLPEVRNLAVEALKRIQPNAGPGSVTRDLPDKPARLHQRSQTIMKPGPMDAASRARTLVADGRLFYEMGKFVEAERKLRSALALEPKNQAAHYYMNLVQAAKASQRKGIVQLHAGRRQILDELNRIRLDHFGPYNRWPLIRVVQELNHLTAGLNSDKADVHFFTAENSDNHQPMVNANTGLPERKVGTNGIDINSILISIARPLTNVTLVDISDAIVSHADKPIEYSILDWGILFSPKNDFQSPRLFSRTFKVNTNVFLANLQRRAGSETNVAAALRRLLLANGLDLTSPESVFYMNRMGVLFVRATEKDLTAVGKVVVQLNDNQIAPQIHIKARFLEIPKGDLDGFEKLIGITNQLVGILDSQNAQVALKALQARSDFKELAAPEVTTLSGRQTEMRATRIRMVITNFTFQEISNVSAVIPQTNTVDTGPVLDIIPFVLADDYTIDLTAIASVTEFLGYDKTTNTITAYNKAGQKVDLPTISTSFDVRNASTHVKLRDGQTLVLGLNNHFYDAGKQVDAEPDYFVRTAKTRGQPNEEDKQILVFITATLVDPAGNRIHSENQMPFVKDSIPAQDSP